MCIATILYINRCPFISQKVFIAYTFAVCQDTPTSPNKEESWEIWELPVQAFPLGPIFGEITMKYFFNKLKEIC